MNRIECLLQILKFL